MEIKGKVAVVTGAGSGIGQTTAVELANRGVKGIALVDLADSVHDIARQINEAARQQVALAFTGNTTDSEFRARRLR